MSHSCDSNEAPSISTASDVIAIEESMMDSDSLSTSGINSNISENSSFIEHTKRNFALDIFENYVFTLLKLCIYVFQEVTQTTQCNTVAC